MSDAGRALLQGDVADFGRCPAGHSIGPTT
jgi:hypothetical protein